MAFSVTPFTTVVVCGNTISPTTDPVSGDFFEDDRRRLIIGISTAVIAIANDADHQVAGREGCQSWYCV